MNNISHINQLPHEILTLIGTYFDDPKTQASALWTCKLWSEVFSHESVWNQALRHYGVYYHGENKRELRDIALRISQFGEASHKIAHSIFMLGEEKDFPLDTANAISKTFNYFTGYNESLDKKIEAEKSRMTALFDKHPNIEEDFFKLALGPKIYDSLPDIKNLNTEDYTIERYGKFITFDKVRYCKELAGFSSIKHPMVKGTLHDVNEYFDYKRVTVEKMPFVIIRYSKEETLDEGETSESQETIVISPWNSFERLRLSYRRPLELGVDMKGYSFTYFMIFCHVAAERLRKLIHEGEITYTRNIYDDLKLRYPETPEIDLRIKKLGEQWLHSDERLSYPELYRRKEGETTTILRLGYHE